MKTQILLALTALSLLWLGPASGQTTNAPGAATKEFGWLEGEFPGPVAGSLQRSSTVPYDARTSKAYGQMRYDAGKMIEAMQMTVALTKKRIEVAKKKNSFLCISCLEEDSVWMQREVDSAVWWNVILEDQSNQMLDQLQAYWAIQDAYEKVKDLKKDADRSWRWQLKVE